MDKNYFYAMVGFSTVIKKFGAKGEKTGWTYIDVPKSIANQLKANCKTSFRVKGTIDDFKVQSLALTPMGEGNFIIALNAAIRKGIGKIHGAIVKLQFEEDKGGVKIATDLMECLREMPDADDYFQQLPQSHKNWYYNWVKAAKTDATITKRIAVIVQACEYKLTFAEMMQQYRNSKNPIQ